MLVVLVATQIVGFVVLYLLLQRNLVRRAVAAVDVVELRSEVNALLAELNGTAERNIALLEDGIRRLDVLLRRVDRHSARTPPNDGGEAAPEDLRTLVVRMRRLGFSKAAIAERLATTKAGARDSSAGLDVPIRRDGRPVPPATTNTGAPGSSAGHDAPMSRGEVELLVNLASDETDTG